ncbi:glycosyltransferase, group 2 family protein [Secundilactobacillus odoratitofui DSM 19909 = JCM 15043]|uniref:Glycosyltransferase, group 2 family protein n=1 Tax=Secundilactobacillus odoratitofui DSM 19909 = JCM 15043 TaxID=1423776 RepID=A0A0R1LVY4_9LACO|nr:glycosyltransferase family 2 protein [Secundilactobacillus odoratitofui]KRK97348.1 glycosyltransferase, group 2 family protein [Secundilactobacillus odoratitofui DSM 19909 = JCM 15043]
MNPTNDHLSIVIPVYNEEAGITETIDVLENYIANRLETYELIFINDGSTDNSAKLIRAASERNANVKLIELSRNFGHQIAITAGLRYASGDAVVVMAADLQDPPAVIPAMIDKWRAGYQVVYGKRVSRAGDSLIQRFMAASFYRIFRAITNINAPLDTGDFRLMDKQVVRELRKMDEPDPFIRGMVSWVGFKQTSVTYERQERQRGSSKAQRKGMFRLAVDGITSFSALPLKLPAWLGGLSMLIGLGYLIGAAFTGLTTLKFLVFALFFLTGTILVSLGIAGAYLFRIFNAAKQRPLYVVAKASGFSSKQQSVLTFKTNSKPTPSHQARQ